MFKWCKNKFIGVWFHADGTVFARTQPTGDVRRKTELLWEKTANPRLECDTQTSSTGANHWLGKMGCQIRAHKRQ